VKGAKMSNGFSDTLSSKQYAEQLLQWMHEEQHLATDKMAQRLETYPHDLAHVVAELSGRMVRIEKQLEVIAILITMIQDRTIQ